MSLTSEKINGTIFIIYKETHKALCKSLFGEPKIYCATWYILSMFQFKVTNHPFLSLGLGEENQDVLSIYSVPGLGKDTVHNLPQLIFIIGQKDKY